MKYVLFVCTHNAGRSQMAQAFFERDCTHDCRAESAGSEPARQVWPEVVQVMGEVGLDLSRQKPKRLSVEMQLHADWAVTMGCGDVCPYVPTRVDDWDIPDPAGRPLDEVRAIRDLIAERVTDLVTDRIEEIESDSTSHQWRLAMLLPGLIDEFGPTRRQRSSAAAPTASLTSTTTYPSAATSSPSPTNKLAECLSHERCERLEALVP